MSENKTKKGKINNNNKMIWGLTGIGLIVGFVWVFVYLLQNGLLNWSFSVGAP